MADDTDPDHPENIHLSTAGFACLTAYWMFGADIFDAPNNYAEISIFPEHDTLLKNLTGENAEVEITGNPGTFESLVVIALWLHTHKGLLPSSPDIEVPFMAYHHQLTLVSVFHPNIRVRNAATHVAGLVLHSDPDEGSRLATLEDLLENCVFSNLQACAVTWLREEIIAARKASAREGQPGNSSIFTSPECFEKLQYTVFPDLTHLLTADMDALRDFWTENAPYHLAVVNFARFLFGGEYGHLAPTGMGTAVEHRYARPLLHVTAALGKSDGGEGGSRPEKDTMDFQLEIVAETLKMASFH